MESFDTEITFEGKTYQLHVTGMPQARQDGTHEFYQVLLNKFYIGNMYCDKTQWKIHSNHPEPQALIDMIGDLIWRYTE
jgi:hypothetical protein